MRNGPLPETNLIIPYISGLLIIMFLLIMIILEANKALSKKSNFIVYLSLIILAVFVAWFFTDNWFTKLFNIFLGKNLVTFFLLFWLIMKINEKTKTFDFAKKELLKFVAIVLYGLVAEFLVVIFVIIYILICLSIKVAFSTNSETMLISLAGSSSGFISLLPIL
ncbi:MAG: hypothetical protein IPN46_01130 [Saprospiraceae bacterium]|nr:hypothetical protein [Saprospiraceae bacterium]